MRKFVRYLAWGAGGLLVLVLLALATVYVMSERILSRTYDAPFQSLAIPTGAAAIAEGARLARIRGCLGGCHGERLEGEVFFDEPWVARLTAGNLTRAARAYDDAELVRIIRYGVLPDGRSVFGMPSAMLHRLDDHDLGAIIAFLRSLPEVEGPASGLEPRVLGRVGLVAGMFRPAAVEVESLRVRLAREPSPDTSRGRYLALTSCSECHGTDLAGQPESGTPSLAVVSGYSRELFTRLMRTGVPADGKERGLMTQVARSRFVHFTGDEIAALYDYLGRLPP